MKTMNVFHGRNVHGIGENASIIETESVFSNENILVRIIA